MKWNRIEESWFILTHTFWLKANGYKNALWKNEKKSALFAFGPSSFQVNSDGHWFIQFIAWLLQYSFSISSFVYDCDFWRLKAWFRCKASLKYSVWISFKPMLLIALMSNDSKHIWEMVFFGQRNLCVHRSSKIDTHLHFFFLFVNEMFCSFKH